MQKQELDSKVAEYLIALGTGVKKPEFTNAGICTTVRDYLQYTVNMPYGAAREYVDELTFTTVHWPESTGMYQFPVPHPTKSPGPAYLDTYNLWDRRTPYGKSRARLCLWLAEQLTPYKPMLDVHRDV